MAIPDFRLCDCCGCRVDDKPLFIATDRKMDAAGSMGDEGRNVDICRECAIWVIVELCRRNVGKEGFVFVPDYEMGTKVVAAIDEVAKMKKRKKQL